MSDTEEPNALPDDAAVPREHGDLNPPPAALTGAIELTPDAEAFYRRGLAYQEKNLLDQAIADYDKAIELDAGHSDALFKRSAVHRLKGAFDKAGADFDQAIQALWRQREVKAEAAFGTLPAKDGAAEPEEPGPDRPDLENAA